VSDLIEALKLLSEYDEPDCPTCCEHDVLHVCVSVPPAEMDPRHAARLETLGFFFSEDHWKSFRFGSA
jgi:hypothetical protein